MQPGEGLYPGESIWSANGRYRFIYQTDGNLVLYGPGGPLWNSQTAGKTPGVCVMQYDGNLVIYGPRAVVIWASNTQRNPGSRLIMQNDGNVVIYNPSNVAVWETETIPPVITQLIPESGQGGDSVIIKGNNFRSAQKVLFGNKEVRFTINSRTVIRPAVPEDAVFLSGPLTGVITVTTPIGSARSNGTFIMVPTPPPIINGFTPASGQVGTGVTITGSNFSRVTTVKFNTVNANFNIGSDSTITTSVPPNATDGPITVINRRGSATSSGNFDVVTTPIPPNLGFINTWMEPTEFPSPGMAFRVYFSFANGGGSPTGRFTIRLQLDNGSAIQDVACPSYAPQTGDVVFWTFPQGLPAGSHFVYAYLDIFNQVVEVSESDNVSYHGFNVR